MEFADVVSDRRMVRAYRPDPVPEKSLQRILIAGRSAPTAGNSRGVSLISVTDSRQRAHIASAAGEEGYAGRGFPRWLSTAPVHLIPCVTPRTYRDRYSEPDKSGSDPDGWTVPYWWIDAGAALMAILLAAVDEDLGAGFLGEHAIPDLGQILGIPNETEPIGVVTIGHPDPGTDRRTASLERETPPPAIHQDRWGF